MTVLEPLPFGAETPDELLVAYANGSLDPAQRAAVERWLAAHPEWNVRLDAYRAVAAAVRGAAAASDAPALDHLGDFWARLDANPQPRPLRAVAPPPAPPGAPPVGGMGSVRPRRAPTWLLAVAAALVVALGVTSVARAVNRGGDSDVTIQAQGVPSRTGEAPPSASGDAGAPPAPRPADAAQALRDSAAKTAEKRTAHTELHALATVALGDTPIAKVLGTDSLVVAIEGTGAIEFPDRSQLTTTTIITGGNLPLPAEQTSQIQIRDQTWLRCDGADYVEQTPTSDPGCTGLDFGAALAGPEATLRLLDSAEGNIENLGREPVGGVDTTHYRFQSSFALDDGTEVPLTVEVWVGRTDDVVQQVAANAQFDLPIELLGTQERLPTTLELTFGLSDFGAPITITAPG